jgi:spore coat polysaccharide biosynthesis predicted glycosyltransferase SpsG
MSLVASKVLFIPVSSASGIGEYMRSLILANAIADSFPRVEIAFVLSKHAPYIDNCPYPTLLTDRSPTHCSAQVNAMIAEFLPRVVVFDCSGRASQYRTAQKCGAKVVFISQHKKKRRRAFALNRIGNIDAHCITQYKFVDGDISRLERLKLNLFRRPLPYFIGPVYSSPSQTLPFAIASPYVLFSAGGGGHTIKGIKATDVFLTVAQEWYRQTGEQCLVLLGPNYVGQVENLPGILCHKQLPNPDVMALLKQARLAVLGGGAMLAQAVALSTPAIAIAVAKDQPERIKSMVQQGLVNSAELSVADILDAMMRQNLLEKNPLKNAALHNSTIMQSNGREAFLTVVGPWLS